MIVLFLIAILRSDKALKMSVIHRGMVEDFFRLSKLLGVDFKKCVSYSQPKRILRSIVCQSFKYLVAIDVYFFLTFVDAKDQTY